MDLHARLPLQGGLPPLETSGGTVLPVVEVACDESGFSGTNLLDAATPVFTHASVDLGLDEAADLVEGLKSGSSWPPGEFKSGQLLRGPRARETLEPLLAALTDRAHVHVVDKELFLATRVVDLLLAEPSYADGTSLSVDLRPAALALYRAGRSRGSDWHAFLSCFVELVRTKKRHPTERRLVGAFFRTRDALAEGLGTRGVDAAAGAVLAALTRTRTRAVLARLAGDDPAVPPPLEPMLPALAETVLFWSAGRRQVLVVHDEQSALTATRLRRLQQTLAEAPEWVGRRSPAPDGSGVDVSALGQLSPLAGLVTVDSRDDPRVQVADLLAGVARRSPEIDRDPLLRPFLTSTSLRDPAGGDVLDPAAPHSRS